MSDNVRRPSLAARFGQLTSTGLVLGVLVLAIVLGAVLTALEGRNFFSIGNVSAILITTSVLGFVAIGQTLVILTGSIDLSVSYVVSLTTVVAASTMDGQPGNVVPAVLLVLAVAAAIGLVNGAVVAYLHVHGFIATLGMGLIVSGYLAVNYAGPTGDAPRSFALVGATRLGPIPLPFVIMLACALLMIVLLRRTRVGHQIYAVGGNPHVTRLSGVRTSVPIITAHVLCSMLTAFAGLLLVARTQVGNPTAGAQGQYDLMSIAAVVLGGTLLAGGKGNITGTLAGVAIFAVMDNVMAAMQTDPFLRDAIRGAVIVAAVAVYARRELDRRPARFERPGVLDAALQEAK